MGHVRRYVQGRKKAGAFFQRRGWTCAMRREEEWTETAHRVVYKCVAIKEPGVYERTLRHLSFEAAIREFCDRIDGMEYRRWLLKWESEHPKSKNAHLMAKIYGCNPADLGVALPPTRSEWLQQNPPEEVLVEAAIRGKMREKKGGE